MKKKLLSILFVCTLIFSLTACDDKATSSNNGSADGDALATFQQVQQNMQEIKDSQMKMTMKMNSPDQNALTMDMSADIQQVTKSADDIEMLMKMDMTAPGAGKIAGTMYMQDKFIYMDMAGQKIKMDASAQMDAAMPADASAMMDISKESIKEITMTEEGDNKVFNIKMDAQQAIDYLKKSGGSGLDSVAGAGELKISKMDLKVVADKDNKVKTMDIVSSMDIANEGQTVQMDYTIALEYVSINTGLTIDFPDFKSYQDVSNAI